MKKYREDRELIALSKEGDTVAQYELWKKWEVFTSKNYYRNKEALDLIGLTEEDYMQEAYLLFMKAVQKFNLDYTEVSNFSTYYYWHLKKIRNEADVYLRRYGEIKVQSDYEVREYDLSSHKIDATDNEWNRAILVDIEDDFKREQAIEVIDTYYEEEKDPLYKKIFDYILMGLTFQAISNALGGKISSRKVSSIAKDISKRINSVADRVMFEPI